MKFKKIKYLIIFTATISFFVSNYDNKARSQNLRIQATSFKELMGDTLATQDAVFEAEKKILSQKQTKKVVEGDYLPSIQSEVLGEYTFFDNFREVPPIDEYELHLSSDWNIYDFGRKHMKYKEPIKGRGIRTLFKKNGFKTYLVDEFRTSCKCSKCKKTRPSFYFNARIRN